MLPSVTAVLALALVLIVCRCGVLTPSERYLNVIVCTFTPAGGSAITIKGIQSATLDFQADSFSEGGDGDLYNTSNGLVKLDPQVTLEYLNIDALSAIAPGAFGTLTFTLGDSRNLGLTAGGATIYTFTNCFLMPRNITATFRQLARKSVVFMGASVDGQTSPIAQAAA
jgi:hypothetical protein